MRAKILSKDDVLRAMRHTRSNRAAARYLGCSYQHYRIYAKMYKDEKTGKSLHEIHLNKSGKGIPKHLVGSKKEPAILDIIEGRIDSSHFTPERIKNKLIHECYLLEECSKCGLNERRIIDHKIPLLLSFKDGNKRNYKLDNVTLYCYNCYFLYIGNVFTPEQEKVIEDIPRDKFNVEKPTWELDEDMLKNMKELGIL